jgi:ankyrin repeat protein
VVRLLPEMGANVAAKDRNGLTALHWATRNGHEAIVRVLLEQNGTNVVAKDNVELMAEYWAAWNGQEAVVEVLRTRVKTYRRNSI